MQVLGETLRAPMLDPRRLAARAALELGAGAGQGIVLLGAGKPAAAMAAGVLDVLEDRVSTGFVVGKHAALLPAPVAHVVAAHPFPDARSEVAGRELLGRAAAARRIVLCLGGGASALAAVPAPGVRLAEKVALTRALAATGADIAALARVRRALSAFKGGRLALATRAHIDALVLSDVVGDALHVIGGGPVSPPPDEEPARVTLQRAGIALAPALAAALQPDVRAGGGRFDHVQARVLAGPDALVTAAAAALETAGVRVVAQRPRVEGDVAALAQTLCAHARALRAARLAAGPRAPALAYVAGGEPTVRLPASPGRGGRAQHTALACALGLAGLGDVAILCAASDGSDGPTSDAGGLVDGGSAARASAAGEDPASALERCDSGSALASAGDLISTGPTGNNLCDLFIVLAA